MSSVPRIDCVWTTGLYIVNWRLKTLKAFSISQFMDKRNRMKCVKVTKTEYNPHTTHTQPTHRKREFLSAASHTTCGDT